MAAEALRKRGYKNVYIITNGTDAMKYVGFIWRRQGTNDLFQVGSDGKLKRIN